MSIRDYPPFLRRDKSHHDADTLLLDVDSIHEHLPDIGVRRQVGLWNGLGLSCRRGRTLSLREGVDGVQDTQR